MSGDQNQINATQKQLADARSALNGKTNVVFTVNGLPTSATGAAPATGSSVQLVTGASQNLWGAEPEVYVRFDGSGDNREYRVTCGPNNAVTTGGNRLVCSIDTTRLAKTNPRINTDLELHIHIIDPGHAGG